MKLPSEIRVDGNARMLTLSWPDGAVQSVDHVHLREACPCAECRRMRLSGHAMCPPDGVIVTEVRSMGYGVQIVFSDGHARGIFPWPYLSQLGRATR